jgi:hypothetical protein
MDFDKCFEMWMEEKEEINAIKNVYGMNGVMAVISFVDFLKEKYDNTNRESDQRDKTHCSGSGFNPR